MLPLTTFQKEGIKTLSKFAFKGAKITSITYGTNRDDGDSAKSRVIFIKFSTGEEMKCYIYYSHLRTLMSHMGDTKNATFAGFHKAFFNPKGQSVTKADKLIGAINLGDGTLVQVLLFPHKEGKRTSISEADFK